jgi:GDP-D-mannose 3', 5'-epimerase
MKKCIVLGAAGFLGQHLEYALKARGDYVVSVARKLPPWRKSVADEYNILDLTNVPEFHAHFHRHRFDEVYQCAAEVGGIGYIADQSNDAAILTNSLKINLHTLEAIAKYGNVDKILFASSQCVYPDRIEIDPFVNERIPETTEPGIPAGFRETDASFNNYAFAKEKLYAESLYQSYAVAHGVEIRIGRLGNTYGPYCAWQGDRAKSVASICRKVAEAPYAGVVDLWGDANQSRSFTYVDDAVEGILRLMESGCREPVNIATAQTVTIKDLFETICAVAGKIVGFKSVDGPVGPRHRGSDNTRCRQVLAWEPTTSLWEGIEQTYPWIREQVEKGLTKPVA